jgi:putative hemolysin
MLLIFSGFFSGSETALFSLSPKQLRKIRDSHSRIHKIISRILDNPSRLLGGILFGNMLVNILYYATVSGILIKFEKNAGQAQVTLLAVVSFAMILIFGEVIPKSFAAGNCWRFSLFVSLPLFVCLQIFAPIIFVFKSFIINPALHLIFGNKIHETATLRTEEFKLLVERVKKRGLITEHENKLLAEISDFRYLKVRHVMLPRVDMPVCESSSSRQELIQKMKQHNITKIPVYVNQIDNLTGLVYFKDLLKHPKTPVGKLIRKAKFVPEQKSLESLLTFFRTTKTDTAIVVNEYGGIAGLIRLEDIAEELFGPIEISTETEPIETIAPFTFRIAGNMPIHEWAESFGIDPGEIRIATIGGLVTSLLGKIPVEGDKTKLRNMTFTVEKTYKNRITSVILKFEPINNND